MCGGEESALHILLNRSETSKCRDQFVATKWLIVNEEEDYSRMLNCTNAVEVRNVETCT